MVSGGLSGRRLAIRPVVKRSCALMVEKALKLAPLIDQDDVAQAFARKAHSRLRAGGACG
jgi:hypothetical protein